MNLELELTTATRIDPKVFESASDYMNALVLAVDALPKEDWDTLSVSAKNWANAATDALDEGKGIPPLQPMGDGDAGSIPSPNRKTTRKPKSDNGPYGLRPGSKRAQAAEMLEKGATMSEIATTLGKSQYNLLKKLKADGHSITCNEGRYTLSPK
tara:strand:+ start:1051 stop:1515 length:465 start_codon:yes stop_codon:yes gene_type:complete